MRVDAVPSMFYQGSLQEGISTAVGQQKLVLCFVTDDGEESTTWETDFLADPSLSDLIQHHAVALRLKAGSDEAGYLAQIFPLPRTPTIVIIKNGDLKEYITPETTKEEFLRRVQGAFSSPSNPPPAQSSSSSANTSRTESVPAPAHEPATASSNLQPERSENVRRILEERAAKLKAEKEAADLKAKEERAKAAEKAKADAGTGENTAAAKKHLQQQAYRKRRQKEEEERRRILRRIEDDKAERRLRAAEREAQRVAETDGPGLGDVAAALVNAPVTNMPSLARASEVTAIQVRLFDGSTIRSRFETSSTVSVVRKWVDESRTDGDAPFTFKQVLTPLPNRNIDATEENKSLGELGLTPSSTLVLIPVHNYVTASNHFGSALVESIVRLIKVAIWQFFDIIYWLFGLENSRTAAERLQARREAAERQRRPALQLYNGNATNTEPPPPVDETEKEE